MKLIIFAVVSFIFISQVSAESKKNKESQFDFDKIMNQYEFLNSSQVKAKWGVSKNKIEDFNKSDLKSKAKMAFSILEDQSLLKKNKDQIVKLFGEPDSYFFSEQNLTYLISKDLTTKQRWALTFLINSDLQVEKVQVVKTCCYSISSK